MRFRIKLPSWSWFFVWALVFAIMHEMLPDRWLVRDLIGGAAYALAVVAFVDGLIAFAGYLATKAWKTGKEDS